MISPIYRAQVDLLLQTMPTLAKERCFGLKGGTAINMFLWDMPRLSVDIDLTYLGFDGRKEALQQIASALLRVKAAIENAVSGSNVVTVPGDDSPSKLHVQLRNAQVKIEVNTTIRGHLHPPQDQDVSPAVEHEFGRFVTMQTVSLAELFGGKICAALDRQHPRDLFDIHKLYSEYGLTPEILEGFLQFLLSSNRPIHELLQPNLLDQHRTFETQFAGMTQESFSYADFESTRERLVNDIQAGLSENDLNMLLNFKTGNPDWTLFPHDRLKDLPAVQWKLANIRSLKDKNPNKHAEQLAALEALFS